MKFVFKHILSLSFDNNDNNNDNDNDGDDDAHRVALQLGQGGRAAGGALARLAVVTHHNILPRYARVARRILWRTVPTPALCRPCHSSPLSLFTTNCLFMIPTAGASHGVTIGLSGSLTDVVH